ncbi:MAG: hydroxyacid-oxoacid transhydrogenase, partial [Candidatus Eremiobacteraeota bacterium]|nr:hydroxyacid-oxoacid transhydrogenase [Candidatus Eremiobacteraeota bacterium]
MQPAPHDHETILEVEAPRVKFGRGAIDEVGPEAAALGLRRVALFTDAKLAAGAFVERARASLRAAGVDFAEFAAVRIEPTDGSFRAAAAFATDAHVDGYVSVGGGSVIDTAKAANLYAT